MPKQRAEREPPHRVEPTTRDAAGRESPPGDRTTPPNDPAAISGSSTDARPGGQPDRAGVDSRQRGWYWHWNGIVTQYAPLIGLKGVGLLNSYTVWTDRREQSPTRGYAFPSQQSEADFYGEDRAELITINKILVALDLIEIRKEMVQRIDAQGRKWKVPHNLYRVKDRPEGLELRTADVLRVAELASRDAAVFRYIKRIFSSRFAPIDRENVWHRILAEVASEPIWRELTGKTAGIEARASARTRAGHKARGKRDLDPAIEDDTPSVMTAGQSGVEALADTEQADIDTTEAATSVAQRNAGSASRNTSVAGCNTGLATDVDVVNTGSQGGDESSAEATNTGPTSVVAPGNATYYQEISTTTTTTTNSAGNDADNEREPPSDQSERNDPDHEVGSPPADSDAIESVAAADSRPVGLDYHAAALQTGEQSESQQAGIATAQRSLADSGAGGPLVDPGPLVVSLFEAANDRRATPLERTLLGELVRDAGLAAGACGETGAEWVAAALREAVASGSAFVAPKRVREIINRWASAGARPGVARLPSPEIEAGGASRASRTTQAVRLPRGQSATRVWQAVTDELARVLDPQSHDRLLSGSRITGYRNGVVELEVSPTAEGKLAAEYKPLLQRHLERHVGKPVTVDLKTAPPDEAKPAGPVVEPIEISRSDAEQGRQLWRAVLNEIEPVTSADDLARLRGALPLGQDANGCIVIGAPTSVAARLIDGRCRQAVERALRTVLGDTTPVKVAGSDEWLVREETSGEA